MTARPHETSAATPPVHDPGRAEPARATLDGIREGAAIIGRDWHIAYVNDAAVRQAQRDRAQLEGRHVGAAFPELRGSPAAAALRRCMVDGIADRVEASIAFPDGWTGWYELSIEPVPEGVFVLSIAITGRKRAEAEMERASARVRSSEAMLTAALDAAEEEIGILRPVLDGDGHLVDAEILFANQAGRERWLGGLNLESVRGERFADRWPSFWAGARAMWASAVESGQSRRLVLESSSPGSPRTYDISINPFHDGFVHVGRDVSASLRSTRALRESEETLRQIIEGVDAVVAYRPGADATQVLSPQVEAMLGYPIEQVREFEFWNSLVHPDDIDRCRAAWDGDGIEWHLRYRMRRADGEWIWVDDRVRRTFTPDGRQDARYGVITDITERMRVDDARAQAETRLRQFVDANVVGVLVADASGRVLEANDYYLDVIGYTRDELERGLADWRAATPAEGRDADLRAIDEVRARGRSTPREKVYRRRDGTLVPVVIVHVAAPGPGDQIASFVVDVTERHRAAETIALTERRFLSAVERLLDPLLVLRAVRDASGAIEDFEIEYANDAAVGVYGAPTAQLVGASLLDVEPAAGDAGLLASYAAAVTTGQAMVADDFTLPVLRDGTLRDGLFEVRASPFGDGLVVTWRDVTERKRLLDALVRTERLDAVSRLSASAAHDFGNVLMGIRIFEQYLEQSIPTGDPRHEDVVNIRRAVQKGTEITEQLLAFGRERAAIAAGPVDVGEFMRMLAPVLGRVAGNAVTLDVQATGADRARIGRSGLEQVLLHLVGNARDAMPSGGRLRISSGVEDREDDPGLGIAAGRYLVVEVADTGVGMPADTLKHAFEPFFTTKADGSGIGLPSVYGIVREAAGAVEIESEPGLGTRVRVLLPHVPPAPRPEPLAPWPHRGGSG